MTTIPLPKDSVLPKLNEPEQVIEEQIAKEINLPSQDEINLNHEQRIQMLEAALWRIKGSI